MEASNITTENNLKKQEEDQDVINDADFKDYKNVYNNSYYNNQNNVDINQNNQTNQNNNNNIIFTSECPISEIPIQQSPNSQFFEYEHTNFNLLNEDLRVKVVDYNKTSDSDLLSSSYYIYQIKCTNYNSSVFRRYNDFVWLRESLKKYYPGLLIPPIPEKSILGKLEKDFHMRRIRDFNRFFDHLAKQKILANSIITKEFLTESNLKEFNRKKNNYTNYIPDSYSFISKLKGKIKYNLKFYSYCYL